MERKRPGWADARRARTWIVRLGVCAAAVGLPACDPGSGFPFGIGGGGVPVAEVTTPMGIVIRLTASGESAGTLPSLSLVAHGADQLTPGGLRSPLDWATVEPAGIRLGGTVAVTFDLSALEVDVPGMAAGFVASDKFATEYHRLAEDSAAKTFSFETTLSGAVALAGCPALQAHVGVYASGADAAALPEDGAKSLSRLTVSAAGAVEVAVPLGNDDPGCLDATALESMLTSAAGIAQTASTLADEQLRADRSKTEWFDVLLAAYESAKRLATAAGQIAVVEVDGARLLPGARQIADPVAAATRSAAVGALPIVAESAQFLCDVGEATEGASLLARAFELAQTEETDPLTRQRLAAAMADCLRFEIDIPAELAPSDRVPVIVSALDAFARPIVGMTVTLESTGGTLIPNTATTDGLGQAAVDFFAGTTPGAFTVNARLLDDDGRTLAQVEFEGTIGGVTSRLIGRWDGMFGVFNVTDPADAPIDSTFLLPREISMTIEETDEQGVLVVKFASSFEALNQAFISGPISGPDSFRVDFDQTTAWTSCLQGGFFEAALQSDGSLRGSVGCKNDPLPREERFEVHLAGQ